AGLFGLYTLCLMIAHLGVLEALFDLSRSDASASHLVLIPFITVTLLYLRRQEIFSSVSVDPRGGLAVILVGLAILAAALYFGPGDTLSAFVAVFVILWL